MMASTRHIFPHSRLEERQYSFPREYASTHQLFPILEQLLEQSSGERSPCLMTLPLVWRWLHFKKSAESWRRNLMEIGKRGVQNWSVNFEWKKIES